jgi:hypothetical protein
MGYSAVGLGVTGARAPDADHMGERGYRVGAPLAAILPAPHNSFSGLRPLLVRNCSPCWRRVGMGWGGEGVSDGLQGAD